jgi:hypothetical protein
LRRIDLFARAFTRAAPVFIPTFVGVYPFFLSPVDSAPFSLSVDAWFAES